MPVVHISVNVTCSNCVNTVLVFSPEFYDCVCVCFLYVQWSLRV